MHLRCLSRIIQRSILLMVIFVFLMSGMEIKASALEIIDEFRGQGNIENPYQISTIKDLETLRDNVNAGQNYAGQYFIQTIDLDLSPIDNWEPIGLFGTEKYFYGFYNGNGHTITNLHIDRPNDNAGLFGQLGGTVYNLGIESGYINSGCSGSIASHSAGEDAQIINCYNKANIHGGRAGGIADNFNGGVIISCWNIGNIEGDYVGEIVSYDAEYILGCYFDSKKNPYNSQFSGQALCYPLGQIDVCYLNDEFDNNTECFIYPLEEGVHCVLKGIGTEEDPYRVYSETDLMMFRNLVNAGYLFYGDWVRQENDIKLSEVTDWVPIGIYNSGKYFYGIYDGYGHTISSLIINDGGNCGFFGQLAGTVMNLGIEDGSISGDCIGSIASHGAGIPMIINCYNKARLYGNYRAGGIADNLTEGIIANCYNVGSVESNGIAAGICSYDAARMMYCNSIIDVDHFEKTFTGAYEKTNHLNIKIDNIPKYYNDAIYHVATYTNYQHNNLFMLDQSGHFSKQYNYKKQFYFHAFILGLVLVIVGIIIVLLFVQVTSNTEKKTYKNKVKEIVLSIKQGTRDIAPRVKIVVGVFAICIFISIVFVFSGDHLLIKKSIWLDGEDALMDFYNPLVSIAKNNYATDGFFTDIRSTYPPIARLVLWLFTKSTTMDTAMRGARNFKAMGEGILLFIIMVLLCYLILVRCLSKLSNTKRVFQLILLSSMPFLYLIERGNILLIAFAFAALFLNTYKSNSHFIRFFSYFCWALSASMKIYPAILALLIVNYKDMKRLLEICFVGILIGLLPFFFCGGIEGIRLYIRNITNGFGITEAYPRAWLINYSNVMREVFSMLGGSENNGFIISKTSIYILVALLVICTFVFRKEYKRLLALTLILILYPSYSCYYVACFYLFPLAILLKESSKKSLMDNIYFLLLLIAVMPLQFLTGVIGVTIDSISIGIGILGVVLALILIIDAICTIGKNYFVKSAKIECSFRL